MSTRDPRLRAYVPPTTTTTIPAAIVAPKNPPVVAPTPTPGPLFPSTPKPSPLQSFNDDNINIEVTGSDMDEDDDDDDDADGDDDDGEDMEMETITSDHIQSGFGATTDFASVPGQEAANMVAVVAMKTMLAPKVEGQEVIPARVPTPVRTMDPSTPAPTRTILPAPSPPPPPPRVKSSSELVADIHSMMREEREELTRVTQRLFALFHRNGRLPQDAWPEEDRIAVLKEQETKKRIMEGFQNLEALIEGMDEITKSITRIAPTLPLQGDQALAMDTAAPTAAVDIQEPLSTMTVSTFILPTATSGLPMAAAMEMDRPVKKKKKTNKERRDAAAAKQQNHGSTPLPNNDTSTNSSNTHPPQPATSPLLTLPPLPPHSSFASPHHPPSNNTTSSSSSSYNNINNSNAAAPPIQKANPAIHANRNLLDDSFPRYQRYPEPPIQPHNLGPPTQPMVPTYKIMSRPVDFLIALKRRAEEVYGEDFEYAYGFIISQATLDDELRALFELDFEYPNMSGWLWTQYEQRFVELALTPQEKQQESEEYALMGKARGETFAQYGERLHRWSIMYRIDQLPNIQKVNLTIRSLLPDNILMMVEVRIVQRCIMRHLNMPEPDVYGMMGVADICQLLGGFDDALDRKALREASERLKKSLENDTAGPNCGNGGGSAFKGPPHLKNKRRPPPATAAPARPRPTSVSYAPLPPSAYPASGGDEIEGYSNDGYTTGYTGYERGHYHGASQGYDTYSSTATDYGNYTSSETSWSPSGRGRGSSYPPRGRGRGVAGASRGRGAASAAAIEGVGGGAGARGAYRGGRGGRGGRGSRGSHGFAPYPPRGGGGYSSAQTQPPQQQQSPQPHQQQQSSQTVHSRVQVQPHVE